MPSTKRSNQQPMAKSPAEELPFRISRVRLPGKSYSDPAPPERGNPVVAWVESMLDSADDGLVLKWSTAELLSGDCIALSSVEGKDQKEVFLAKVVFFLL